MEKQGVIKTGLTNPEHEPEKVADDKSGNVAAENLDNDFRKRAAAAAQTATN